MPMQLDTTSEQNILNMLMDQAVINADQMTKIKAMSKEIGKSRLETAFELNLTDEKKNNNNFVKGLFFRYRRLKKI